MRGRQALAVFALACAALMAVRNAAPGRPPTRAVSIAIDINTAPPELLETLPRVGPSMARKIVAARKSGPFASAADLRKRVKGIGPVTSSLLEAYIRKPENPQGTVALKPDPRANSAAPEAPATLGRD